MLEAGEIDVALLAYGSNQRSSGGKLSTPARPSPYEAPYRPLFPASGYALAAARHMHEFGTTREDLAAVAVAARQWANRNPEAFATGDLTIDDCLASRMITSPLSKSDFCLVTDGAAAIVLTRSDRARDSRPKAVSLLGAAAATSHHHITSMPDLTMTAASESGPRAMQQAGISPSDVDVVQLYDAFTINTILFLEDLGFCAKGEGGSLVSSGPSLLVEPCRSTPTVADSHACILACTACSRSSRAFDSCAAMRPAQFPAPRLRLLIPTAEPCPVRQPQFSVLRPRRNISGGSLYR
ncbi:thiolase C-terminal domain-containing protein [Sphingomonas daechungensis]|nr:hypothetical protein [Sphingomonas daechungensis]